jgi:HlyD family secretion protein
VQNVVTYDVVVAVDNDQLLLRPGMTATTRIVVAKRASVLRVPDQALRYTPVGTPRAKAGSQVWVLRGGAPHAVAVKLGLDDDAYSEVLEGDLHDGDAVVTGEVGPQRGAAPGAPRFFGR